VTGWLWRLADAVRHHARRRSWTPTEASGRRGEDLAHRYLEREAFVVVARNWRGAGGEIDIIAWDREEVVFVEVKSRAADEFGAPERNIDADKRRALERAGREYCRRAGIAWEQARFDLVSVILCDPPRIEHLRKL
jgi:putative endonuclease